MENRKALKEWEQRDAATIRFGLISDVHVQDTTFTLDLALEAFQEIGGLNGLLLYSIIRMSGEKQSPMCLILKMERSLRFGRCQKTA